MQRESIYIVGSALKMGQWNVKNGLKLISKDERGKEWIVTTDLNSDSIIEYKYIIKG